ncbi:MAG: Rrf2 family transcriptional regulator [Flavobacteriales bacterium]|nr:Rrf2 family transcriptional regulator [Flavobacteriales bacterium]
MFSKACEYAIRAVVCIAACGEGKHMNLKAVAKETAIPEAFTAKVLQQLVHAELVLSTKGPGGATPCFGGLAHEVKLSPSFPPIDGDAIHKGCALGLPHCDAARPCACDHFLKVREDLRRMLERTSVQDLVKDMKEGGAVLKR